MTIRRHASATWTGTVPAGKGTMRLGRDGAEFPFSLKTRTDEGPGTNPEELLGAAHAGCFSMALCNLLEEAGHEDPSVQTTALVHLEQRPAGFTVTRVDLTTTGTVDGLDAEGFGDYAEKAKETCTVSRLFSSAEIIVSATLQ